jgi:hypothetical protein
MQFELKLPEQIAQRIQEHTDRGSDPFGFAREVLAHALPRDMASEWLEIRDDTAWPDPTVREVHGAARDYYHFALGKAQDHRGLSAGRSVVKLTEFAWLLGQDELAGQMQAMADSEKFAPYGAPILKHFAQHMRLPFPTDGENYPMWRMGNGWPCRPDCDYGCRPAADEHRTAGAL